MLKELSILYVEDDEVTVEIFKQLLEDYVKEIFVAYDGVQGLEMYESIHPDIVISDINMPNMNGLEMAAKIKNINPKQHIVVVTAFDDVESLLDAANLGVDDYVQKPIIDIARIVQVLDKLALKIDQVEQRMVEKK